MSKKEVLLSICIPTFNRSAALRETLESITNQDIFVNTHAVEIVVSDNASTDDTSQVVSEYASLFPGKIVSYRQETNVWSANFHQALSMGSGQYLKLHNDTLLVRPGALQPLVEAIREFADTRPLMFMTNGNRLDDSKALFAQCQSLDEFVQKVSYFSTWIGGFGLWREELDLALPFKTGTNHLIQTEIVCRQMAAGRPAVVFFGTYFLSKQDFRRAYNWTEVFGNDYLSILKSHVVAGQLGQAIYDQAKKEVFLRHILPNYLKPGNDVGKGGFFDHLADYRDDDYFYEAIANHMAPLWRFSNPLNQTALQRVDSARLLARVRVGRASLGKLNVLGPRTGEARLTIGRFVTIGENVSFIVGEIPPSGNAMTTYWPESTSDGMGSITVNDDVWIGSCSSLLSGVTVGQGAIIAAGSVVTEDVPPYSRVSGNPARIIDYRFSPEVIEKLCAYQFSTLVDDVIAKVGSALHAPLNADNIDAFLHLLKAESMSDEQTPATVPALQPQEGQPVPAVLVLDCEGSASKVEASLGALAISEYRELPVIVLTTQAEALPEWTDSLRYLQVSAEEFADTLEQLRVLPDFEWIDIVEAGR